MNSKWHRKNVGKPAAALREILAIQMKIVSARAAAGDDRAYTFYDVRDKSTADDVILYFPPATHQVAQSIGAEPCDPPDMIALKPLLRD